MKNNFLKAFSGFVALMFCLSVMPLQAFAQTPQSITTPDKVESRIGTLDFKDGELDKLTITLHRE